MELWINSSVNFSSVQSLSHVQLSATPWTAACQASLSITNSRSLFRLTSIESVMPSNWEGNRQEGEGSPNGGNRLEVSNIFSLSLKWLEKQTTSVKIFSPSLYKFKKRFLLKCWICHGHTCFHLNLTFHNWTGFSSVTQSCPTLYDPMDCSMPGFPVHNQHPEYTQSHVHWVGDAIQPSHPLLSPSHTIFNLSQHQGLFKWVSSLH